jgi:CubicO group peptidase (beta-lactamase class C family)
VSAVQGFVAPGFEPVRARFAANFEDGPELGAAFAAYQGGRLVVDLWGGVADAETGEPWREDSLCLVFSGTKGLVATCMLQLVDRGLLDLEAPVCRYWPEFAANGKEDVLVRHVVSHQAGMPGLRREVALDEVHDVDHMAALLADEPLFWPAGSRTWYHPITYGWLCAGLVRRITGRSLGDCLRTEVVEPLGLEVWIGLPAELEPRVARCRVADDWEEIDPDAPPGDISPRDVRDIWRNPDLFIPDLPWNRHAFHAGEIPGANAIGTARAMARHYGVLACGGSDGEVTILSPEAIAFGQTQLADGVDPCHGERMRMGVGWWLQSEVGEYGPIEVAFGHGGAGGSLHGAWPQQGVGFSYVMNLMRSDDEDTRAVSLLETLHTCM